MHLFSQDPLVVKLGFVVCPPLAGQRRQCVLQCLLLFQLVWRLHLATEGEVLKLEERCGEKRRGEEREEAGGEKEWRGGGERREDKTKEIDLRFDHIQPKLEVMQSVIWYASRK